MRIIVFGAAFDPPHNGHQLMVETVLKLGLADGVWLLPAKRHPFDKTLSDQKHRLAMLQSLMDELDDASVRIEDYELSQDSTSYTYQTLKALQKLYPNHTLSFLIGSDNLLRFADWDNYQQLLREFAFYVYPRVGFAMKPFFKGMVPLTEVKQVDISSTQIRGLISQNKPFSHLLPAGAFEYIQVNRLYLDNVK